MVRWKRNAHSMILLFACSTTVSTSSDFIHLYRIVQVFILLSTGFIFLVRMKRSEQIWPRGRFLLSVSIFTDFEFDFVSKNRVLTSPLFSIFYIVHGCAIIYSVDREEWTGGTCHCARSLLLLSAMSAEHQLWEVAQLCSWCSVLSHL